ncbi:YbaB/EbfC family nucleoid-associated protein [Lignipirellula cremea]|uniref:Nucleoid-associated protein Pla8534_65030 n=1 Tax=Lignipirellula cremea TaxID=2528010 RepID=A0A518E3G7_9BACT|nr:YbaB/EbfC family nucleoid-associated protein [Lignipirellula cremea]QDU98631.1 Nucleoid-associated protein YbaB [Lignipirellula cremea]
MFKGIANLANLMRMGQQMGPRFEQMQEQLKQQRSVGSAGGGMVEVTVNGLAEVQRVKIDPKLIAQNDAEMLETLVAAAVNQALASSREESAQAMQSLTEGFDMPGISEALSQFMGGK